jgi:hypothetical protein
VGGASVADLAAEVGHPGLIRITTSSAAGGDQGSMTRDSAGARWRFGVGGLFASIGGIIRIPTVATAAQDFDFRAGLQNSNFVSTATRWISLRHTDALGANWHLSLDDGGATTNVDTGVAVVAGAWVVWRFEVNPNATLATLYLDGRRVASSAAVPTSGAMSSVVGLQKTVGETARTADLDYFEEVVELPPGLWRPAA